MRKTMASMIPSVALVVVVITFAMLEASRPPNWRLELDKYLAFTAVPSETATFQMVAPAWQPRNFSPEMASPVLTDWRWGNIEIPPPVEIRCVVLERVRHSTATTEQTHTQEVVLVGYHTDLLWNDSWIVHELAGGISTEESRENLAALGCDLELDSTVAGPADVP